MSDDLEERAERIEDEIGIDPDDDPDVVIVATDNAGLKQELTPPITIEEAGEAYTSPLHLESEDDDWYTVDIEVRVDD